MDKGLTHHQSRQQRDSLFCRTPRASLLSFFSPCGCAWCPCNPIPSSRDTCKSPLACWLLFSPPSPSCAFKARRTVSPSSSVPASCCQLGTLLTASSLLFFQFLQEAPIHLRWAPVSWWAGRIVLGLLLVVALLVEHFLPRSRRPRLEIAGALLTVVGLTYIITAALRRLPPETSPHPLAFIPNPQQLLPAGIFLISLVWFRRRLQIEDSAFDRAIYSAAWMNVAAQLAASQSVRLLDSPFVLAQALTVASYAVALGGALLDNARLFEQVQHLAVSDPLTGLANYRRLLDVLESETERTNRNSRPFAVLLLDLDGLKKINDTYGHLVGSRAALPASPTPSASIAAPSTPPLALAATEFALVLPESQESEAQLVAGRIREVLAADTETPPLSASIGISIYKGDGERIEKLLSRSRPTPLRMKKLCRTKHPTTLHPRRRAQKPER